MGIMEKKMETLGPFKGICRDYIGLFWGYMGIMEKKMETTLMGLGFIFIGVIYGDNGKELGNYYNGFRG